MKNNRRKNKKSVSSPIVKQESDESMNPPSNDIFKVKQESHLNIKSEQLSNIKNESTHSLNSNTDQTFLKTEIKNESNLGTSNLMLKTSTIKEEDHD